MILRQIGILARVERALNKLETKMRSSTRRTKQPNGTCKILFLEDPATISIYSDELPQGSDQRNNEKSTLVATGRLRTGGVKVHAIRGLIKPNATPSSVRMECRVARGDFTHTPSRVGSRAGARTIGSGGDSIAFAVDRIPATMVTVE